MSRLTEKVDNVKLLEQDIRYLPKESSMRAFAVLNKLGELEDLEEQGRLIELPCKVGDIVYKVHTGSWKDYIEGNGRDLTVVRSVFMHYDIPQFGNLVFLTKEEAEAKLNGLKGE